MPDIKQSGGYHAVFTSASRCLSIILSFFLCIFRSPFFAISQTNQHRMHIHILHTYIKSAAITLTHKAAPSLGQWKTVAMAAHPEPCCRMIRRVMLLNQPPFSALLCSALAVIKKNIISGQRKEINYYVSLVFLRRISSVWSNSNDIVSFVRLQHSINLPIC